MPGGFRRLNCFSLLFRSVHCVSLYSIPFLSLFHNSDLPLRYMIIQYLIRTLRLPVSVWLYVLPVVTPSNFSFYDPEIASFSSFFIPEITSRFSAFSSGIPSFFSQLPTLFRFRIPFVFLPLSFGTAKVRTFFKLANFIFFIFVCLFFPALPSFLFLVCGLQRCDFLS